MTTPTTVDCRDTVVAKWRVAPLRSATPDQIVVTNIIIDLIYNIFVTNTITDTTTAGTYVL